MSQKECQGNIDRLLNKYRGVCFTDDKVEQLDGTYATEERVILDVGYSKGKYYFVDTDLVEVSKRLSEGSEGTRETYYFDKTLHCMIDKYQTKNNCKKLY